MRTTVIPAQITTVEDKIAGNLNLTQILLLMVPVFWTTIVYALFIPSMKLSLYKLPLVLIVMIICFALSLRIKGKVVLNWLIVLLRFNARPKFYIFNKNDSFCRVMDLPNLERKNGKLFKKTAAKKTVKIKSAKLTLEEIIKLEHVISNPKYSLSFRAGKKGGLNVAFDQIQK
ncbi:hypothetical protein M1349_05115 [Patescibacteria group bacterium]|nr:hypothetical protein [Patescibacteria group bacterium]